MSSTLRTIVLVGPRLAGADAGTAAERAYAWTATLKLAFQGSDRLDRAIVNSTQGLRVVLQSPQADVGRGTPGAPGAGGHGINVPLMSPQLLQLVAGTTPADTHPIVQFCAVAGSTSMPASYALLPGAMLDSPGTRGMAGLLVAPEEKWPMPQSDAEIDVPRMRLVEGRLSVLIDATQPPGAPPFGFLGLVQDKATDGMLAFAELASAGSAQLPFVRLRTLPSAPAGAHPRRYVRIELTPEGIEFDAEVADPSLSLDVATLPLLPKPLELRLRLTNRIDAQGRDAWALYPVDDDKLKLAAGALNRTLDALQDALSASATLQVGIDTRRDVPPVCWPLALSKDGLRPLYKVDDATSRADWCIELREGLATMLAADTNEDGELKTTSDVSVDYVRFTALDTGRPGASIQLGLHADRRRRSAAPLGGALAPPTVSIDLVIDAAARSRTRTLSVTPAQEHAPVTWTLDADALAAELVARYTRAGVQPESAAATFMFVPVNDGWLQWPLDLPSTNTRDRQEGVATDTMPLDGELAFELDVPASESSTPKVPPDLVGGRRIRLTACDVVSARASFQPGAPGEDPTLSTLHVDLLRCTGEASGLLWFATASPLPAEILPSLVAGPLALQSAWLDFGRWQQTPDGVCVMQSTAFNPQPNRGFAALELTLDIDQQATASTAKGISAEAVLWRSADGLPVVTAIAMTRTSDGGTVPLSTRQLLPHKIDLAAAPVKLRFNAGQALPDAIAKTPELLHPQVWGPLADLAAPPPASPPPEIWNGVPLVAVTLPGVEFQASTAPFAQRAMRLQFGLPVLDELWTLARLPQTSADDAPLDSATTPTSPAGAGANARPPQTFPTSLDQAALRDTWISARDHLLLTRTQASLLGPGWVPQQRSKQAVTGLFEGTTWQTAFELAMPVTLGGRDYPFGTYDIGGAELHGNAVGAAGALAGYSGRFRLTGNDITPVPDGPDGPDTLRIAGFAAALFATPLAGETAWRDTRGAVTARKPGKDSEQAVILRDMDSALAGGYPWQRATLRKPIPIAGPDGKPLAFWFRDLPLAPPAAQGDAEADTTLTNPIAFRPNAGPRALGRPELAVGPTADALDPAWLPSSTYEWRFTAQPAGTDSSASYVIELGALSFRPLRLVDVTVDQLGGEPAVSRIAILGTLGATVKSTDEAPFGSDMACATGSPVVLTLQRGTDGLFAFAAPTTTWRAAELDRVNHRWICPLPGDAPTTDQTISLRLSKIATNNGTSTGALLTLTLDGRSDGQSGRPIFADATADVVLFGRLCRLGKGTVSAGVDDLGIDFKPGAGVAPAPAPACGVQISEVRFLVSAQNHAVDGGPATSLTLAGTFAMQWTAGSTAGAAVGKSLKVISLDIGAASSTLHWLNHAFILDGNPGNDPALADRPGLVVDHASGLLTVEIPDVKVAALVPVAGMSILEATGKASLRVVFPPSLIPFTGNLEASCALGLLDFASARAPAGAASPQPASGITAFRHVVRLDKLATPVSSDIEVDLDWTTTSLIEWPLEGIAPAAPASWPKLSEASGQAIYLTQSPDPAPRRHTVHLVVKRARLDTTLLCWKRGTRAQVSLEHPWVLRARARHEIRNATDADSAPAVLAWTAIDHVAISGGRATLETALRDHVKRCEPNETRDFAFSPRYQTASDGPSIGAHGEAPQSSPSFAKAGLALRQYALAGFPTEPIAYALSQHIQFGDAEPDMTVTAIDDGKPWIEGLVISGAGPVTIRVPGADVGYFLALPWIAMLTREANSFAQIMPKLHQGPPAGALPVKWAVPDIDVAGATPQSLSFALPMALALESDVAADLDSALDDALASARGSGQMTASASRALMPVEQVFLQPAASTGRVAVEQQPLWLRSLLTLRNLLAGAPPLRVVGGRPKVEQIIVSGRSDGITCRLALKEPATQAGPTAADTRVGNKSPAALGKIQLLALGHAGLASATLGTADSAALLPQNQLVVSGSRIRLLARADSLVGATVCAVVSLQPGADGRLQWESLEALTLRDDPVLAPALPLRDERAFASPNLGWPTTGAPVEAAAAASLGMGDDRPFQDRVDTLEDADPANAPDLGDVKRYGSGFSGRVANLSLPARADRWAPDTAAFYVHGHKTLLVWPSQLTLASPPARHLSVSYARLRLPGLDDSMRALNAFDTTIPVQAPDGAHACPVQPMVPPNIERTTYGSRPGALHAEFDALAVRAWNAPALAGDTQSLAFAGDVGPMLVRQVRAPRGVELPRVPLLAMSSAAQPPVPESATDTSSATPAAATSPAAVPAAAAPTAAGAAAQAPVPVDAVATMVETHGRRTFVAADDVLERMPSATEPTVQGPSQPRPFRLFDGVATVLRTVTAQGRVVSLHLVVRGLVQMLSARELGIGIEVSSPTTSLTLKDLQETLVALGLLPAGSDAPAPSAALTVGNASAAFGRVEVTTPKAGPLLMTLRFARDAASPPSVAANAVCRLLEEADGDTAVVLTYVGTYSAAPVPSPSGAASTTGMTAGFAAASSADSGAVPSQSPAPPWIVPLSMPDATAPQLAPEPRQKLVFRLPVQPRLRAALAVRTSTLVFGDPAYDRLLSGPGAGSQQRDADGKAWKLAFDRFVYSLDTPLYFAFGCLLSQAVSAQERKHPAGTFDPSQTQPAKLGIKQLRARPGVEPMAVSLRIAGVLPGSVDAAGKAIDNPTYDLLPGTPYSLTLDALRTAGPASTFDLQAGDLLMFSLTRYQSTTDPNAKPKIDLQLEVVVRLALQSVIPASPAVYSLVTAAADPAKAVVALHAARPLPQRIELPHLLGDLAEGHIRRKALFEWALPRATPESIMWATLVKIDSAGGGQVPSRAEDIARRPESNDGVDSDP